MKKEDFLEQLKDRMSLLSVTDEEITTHIARFEAYFAHKTEDECEQAIATMGGLDGVMASLEAFYQPTAESSDETPSQTQADERDEPFAEELPEQMTADEHADEASAETKTMDATPPEISPILPTPIRPRHGAAFWTVFALTLPLTLSLFAAMQLLFVGAFALLAVLIAALAVSSVLLAAAGSALSLIAIVYGGVRLFTYLPVGLYELGLGIVILALTLILSILIYNLAVRLLPFVMRKTAELYGKSNRAVFLVFKKEGEA